jgi:hypothetical protein
VVAAGGGSTGLLVFPPGEQAARTASSSEGYNFFIRVNKDIKREERVSGQGEKKANGPRRTNGNHCIYGAFPFFLVFLLSKIKYFPD